MTCATAVREGEGESRIKTRCARHSDARCGLRTHLAVDVFDARLDDLADDVMGAAGDDAPGLRRAVRGCRAVERVHHVQHLPGRHRCGARHSTFERSASNDSLWSAWWVVRKRFAGAAEDGKSFGELCLRSKRQPFNYFHRLPPAACCPRAPAAPSIDTRPHSAPAARCPAASG